ncbi:MAG: glycosyltransferase family 1 protein [Magnetococcales bacterium]|nr:glycosyltransferase family 1 protein [Magnetococcales bacterium]
MTPVPTPLAPPSPPPENWAVDSFYFLPELAHAAARQNRPVKLAHPTIIGQQVCYYPGPPVPYATPNMVAVPMEDAVDFFAFTRYRRPSKLVLPVEWPEEKQPVALAWLSKTLSAALSLRNTVQERLTQTIRRSTVTFSARQPLRIYLGSSRLTTVMQYTSKGIAKALEELGHEVTLDLEQNGLEQLHFFHHIDKIATINPHLTIWVNHLNNYMLSPEVVNCAWFQDPMSQIVSGQPLPLRSRDVIFSLSPEIDHYLRGCGVEHIQRQFMCVDHTLFRVMPEVRREPKVVFVGSSYRPHLSSLQNQPGFEAFIGALQEAFAQGHPFHQGFVLETGRRHGILLNDSYWSYVANYIVRDTTVRWLCANPTTKVEIYGRYWDQDPLVAPHYKGELPHGPALAEVYNSASMALCVIVKELNSQRLAEIAACGAVPLIYDTRDLAEPPHWDEDALFFRTQEQLNACLRQQRPMGNPERIALPFHYTTLARTFLREVERLTGVETLQ